MNIGIYTNTEDEHIDIVESIKKEALKKGFVINNKDPEIVFFVGGDGTFLRAVQHYIDNISNIEFIGINAGTLGFFYDFDINQIVTIMSLIEKHDYKLISYPLLEGNIHYSNHQEKVFAVNEIRIENPFHTLVSDVIINDEYLETFRGNGLVLSSPLGSSAYNKSLGGSVISPELEVLELTEIASIQNSVYHSLGSSLILSGDSSILLKGPFKHAVVGYDHLTSSNKEIQKIWLSTSSLRINLIYPNDQSFIKRLNKSFVR